MIYASLKVDKFVINKVNHKHNHRIANDPRVCAVNRKLNAARMERTVSLLTLPGNTPARVANMLQNEGTQIQKKDIYNICYQFVKQGTSADDRLHFIMELEDKNYHARYSANDPNEVNMIFLPTLKQSKRRSICLSALLSMLPIG